MVLIGNNSALVDHRRSTREGRRISEEIWNPFYETSAKTDSSVTESLIALVREMRRLESTNNHNTKKEKKKSDCKLS